MKKIFLFVLFILFTKVMLMGQARIPVIMVRPGTTWCKNNECYKIVDNQGTPKKIIDYEKALENMDMLSSITEMEGLLTDEGLIIQNMEGASEGLEEDMMEDDLTDDEFGNGLEKSALDKSRERVSADINLGINWEIKSVGPKKQLSYILLGTDAYTNEVVCNVTGLGEPSFSATDAQLLREAVIMKMPELKERLQAHFDKILTIGRLVTIEIGVSTASSINLESSMGEANLGRVINKWLTQNAVQHRVIPGKSTRNVATYRVRIPLYDVDELPISSEDFAWKLTDFLAKAPFNLKCRVQNKGLGKAKLIINGK